MRHHCWLALVGLTIAHPAQADTMELAPSSGWQLNYADPRCRISRAFGEGDDQTVVYFEQYAPSGALSWVVAGSAVENLRVGHEMTVQFGPAFEPFEIEPPRATLGDYGEAVRGSGFARLDAAETEAAERAYAQQEDTPDEGIPHLNVDEGRGIEWLRLSQGEGRVSKVAVGNLGPVYSVMNSCMENLIELWGADLAKERHRQRGPRWVNLEKVAGELHYPAHALNVGAQAILHVRIMVDEEGGVTSCHITDMTQAEEFDDRACKEITKLAKFEPALDAAGKPMPSFYVNRIMYRMP